MASANKIKHNHPRTDFGAYVAPGECPRCDQLRAARAAEGETQHNHERLPFGRRKPLGDCLRCDELHKGAKPRESATARQERFDAERSAAIKKHTNETCHYMTRDANGYWSGVCVCFDW